MAAQYVVVAACVVAKTNSDTGEGYYYRDAILPSGVPVAEKQRLVDAGLVKAIEDEAPADVVDEPAIANEPPRAGKGSGRNEWAAYAASLGIAVDPDATRDDIIAAVDDEA